jgi:tetratricopeptide (TPR) repeat protein
MKSALYLILAIFLATLTVDALDLGSERAPDLIFGFESANKLFEEGNYAGALAGYDKLLETGNASEALYFNRGNTLFKLGQVGRAIASYRVAQSLAPRDLALRANLQFARTTARGGSPYHRERWRIWIESLSLNEWTLLTAAAVWLLFILLALRQWRPALRPALRNYFFTVCVVVLVVGVCFGIVVDENCFTQSAIVITGEADVRNGPLDESQSLYKVRDGIEVEILDRQNDWLQVVDSAQRVGWLRRDQVLLFNPSAGLKDKSSQHAASLTGPLSANG